MLARMGIAPDTKDWTWVLRERCAECGLTAAEVEPTEVAGLVRSSVPAWRDVLAADDAARRPDASTWSPLEYGCHVRDVMVLFRERVQLMVDLDDPLYENWDQDATAVEQRYGEQDPGAVARELAGAAAALADRFDTLTTAQWRRTGRRSDGSTFTVATLAQYFWHDVAHHLWDVGAR